MWRLSGLFLLLSIGTAFWLTSELGLLSYTPAGAAEEPGVKPKSGDDAIESLRRALEDRGKHLDEQEAALKQREHTLADKEAILNTQMAQYEKFIHELRRKVNDLEEELRKKAGEVDAISDRRTESMRHMYEIMEPKQAAKILNTLDIELATRIIEGMKRDKAAEIMSKLTPERARMITERVIGKNPAKKSSSSPIASTEK